MFSVADVYCTFVIGYADCVWVSLFNGDVYFGDDIMYISAVMFLFVLSLSMSNLVKVSYGWQ